MKILKWESRIESRRGRGMMGEREGGEGKGKDRLLRTEMLTSNQITKIHWKILFTIYNSLLSKFLVWLFAEQWEAGSFQVDSACCDVAFNHLDTYIYTHKRLTPLHSHADFFLFSHFRCRHGPGRVTYPAIHRELMTKDVTSHVTFKI